MMARGEINFTGTPDEVYRQLDSLAARDKAIETKGRKTGKLAILGCAAGIGLIIIGAFASLAVIFIPGVVLLVSGIVLIVFCAVYASRDIEDRRINIGKEILKVLKADISTSSAVVLRSSFENYQKGGVLINKDAKWSGGQRELEYTHPWFDIRGKLLDGTMFKLAIIQKVKRKEKRKRKYTKVKENLRESGSLLLRANPKLYPDLRGLESELSGMASPEGIIVKGWKVRNHLMKLSFATANATRVSGRGQTNEVGMDHLVNGKLVLSLFLWVYNGFGLMRARTEKEA